MPRSRVRAGAWVGMYKASGHHIQSSFFCLDLLLNFQYQWTLPISLIILWEDTPQLHNPPLDRGAMINLHIILSIAAPASLIPAREGQPSCTTFHNFCLWDCSHDAHCTCLLFWGTLPPPHPATPRKHTEHQRGLCSRHETEFWFFHIWETWSAAKEVALSGN